MMCDNLSLYKTYIPSSSSLPQVQPPPITPPFYPMDNHDEDEHRTNASIKRKLSDYEDNHSSLTTFQHLTPSFNCNNSDEDDEEDEDDGEGSSGEEEEEEEEEAVSDDESDNTQSITRTTTPCTITQRRHSDTIHTSSSSLSYGTPIVKRRCTYSCMYDDEQKRSVLVESYRKLRGVKKPKLQVSLLICNLIKRLERTFNKSPPLSRPPQPSAQQHQHVQYYQHRTTYRSSSSDSIYMSTSMPPSLVNDEIETTTLTPLNQQYSPPHSSTYDSDKVLLGGGSGDLRSSSSSPMYHPSSTDAYWLAQSNFAIPVVSTSDDDDVDVSLQGGGDYLDLSDNTLASSFSSCSSSSPSGSSSSPELISASVSMSNDCCCSSSTSSPLTKLLVDTNNNNNNNDDYYVYHHHAQHHQPQPQLHSNQDLYSPHQHSSSTEQAFFYHHHHHHHHNGTNTVDIITTA